MTTRLLLILLVGCGLAACERESAPGTGTEPVTLDSLAREYLFVELSMGNIDSGHVDAYFGPEDIKLAADEAALTLEQIAVRAQQLAASLATVRGDDDLQRARIDGLHARLQALETRIAINQGNKIAFDDETRQLFGTVAPSFDAAHFDVILEQIDALLPGDGPLSARVEAFEDQFNIPADKLATVFETAIAECRARTLEHIQLVDGESFTIEYVSDKPWSGYNWYQGESISLIQVNTDLPTAISRAVDLGCHEGYPGHHTYNALLERSLVKDKGWLEFSLYPLFSPQSVIAEGSGNYGIKLAFPGDERTQFEKEVLFPLAGLEASRADAYYALLDLKKLLNYAGNEAARAYLNGDINREQAVDWLVQYALSTQAKAEQSTRFFDSYRSYVINYNHGMDLVADYVERDEADIEERWRRFEKILSMPMLPVDLEP